MNANKKNLNLFYSLLGLTFVCIILNLPVKISLFNHTFYRPDFNFKLGTLQIKPNTDLKYGLDLAGGASLTYNIDTSTAKTDDLNSALESLKVNIERRINLFGVSESNVQLSKQGQDHRLVVELPGITDVNDAIKLIGRTATLRFMGIVNLPPEATMTATFNDQFKDTGLNGSHLEKASPTTNPNTGAVEISLKFNPDGAKIFEKATTEYLDKQIAILLDDQVLMAPTVSTVIPDGNAVINGSYDIKLAKSISAMLNAGALPLKIDLLAQSQIGASLGKDSIDKGVRAGLVGLGLVALFMIGNYGYLGFISVISLGIYGLLSITIYRLFSITLTFPGIVGFILSIGMAVDSNILIFERMKEEVRAGKPWNLAMELGFGKAWDSIKDANTCTIITALILFNPFNWQFLNSSGMLRGFAVTLLIGIILGIFTGVVVTRNLLRVLASRKKI
jgi:preprotein translocase subunit SecD